MSRVVSHTIKQASLNLQDMADKKAIDINEDDIKSILKDAHVIHSASPSFTWKQEDTKPDALEGLIEQIKSIFDVGTEVEGFSVKYYSPPPKNDKGRPATSELVIPPIEKGLGGRFIVLFGTKEVPTLKVSAGSTGASNEYLMLSGQAMYLKLTLCPVVETVFSNNFSEKMSARKGFREMIVKKNPFNRHVFVIDAHVALGAVAKRVKDELIGLSSEETVEKILGKSESDVVAEMAKSKINDSKTEKE